MSMLAEPKRKVRWHMTPYSRAWSQDTNKLGQKMLEKMGWQQGEGLGRLGDGITDPIKATFKHGNTGVGWCGSQNEEFVPYQGDFDSLLKNLKNSHGVPTNASKEQVSLESKSKSSRKRVHYQKFIRGKDISQYSFEDKQSVLGKKIKRDEEETSNNFGLQASGCGNDSSQYSQNDDSSDPCVKTFTSSTNMLDYFSNLTKRKKKNKNEPNDDIELPENDQNEAKSNCSADQVGYNTNDVVYNNDEAEYNADEGVYNADEASYNADEGGYNALEVVYDTHHMGTGIGSNEFTHPNAKACRRKRKNQKKKEKKRKREAEKNANKMCEDTNSSLKDDEISSDDITKQPAEKCRDDDAADDSSDSSSPKHASLKSCLRLSASFSSIKSVTFNDEVSYEIIPPRSTDSGEDIEESVDPEESALQSPADDLLPSLKKNGDTKIKKTTKNSDSSATAAATPSEEKSLSKCVPMQTYMSLPVFGGSTIRRNIDSWSVTLKMAEKMSHYNSIKDSISKHSVLCTTNLLEIKGYGN